MGDGDRPNLPREVLNASIPDVQADEVLCRAVRAGRFGSAAMFCVHVGRMADALMLAVLGG